jgi:hypothetical protein
MSFIVQISPFVHLLTLKIVYQKPRRKLCLHFILFLATPLESGITKQKDIKLVIQMECNLEL